MVGGALGATLGYVALTSFLGRNRNGSEEKQVEHTDRLVRFRELYPRLFANAIARGALRDTLPLFCSVNESLAETFCAECEALMLCHELSVRVDSKPTVIADAQKHHRGAHTALRDLLAACQRHNALRASELQEDVQQLQTLVRDTLHNTQLQWRVGA